MFSCMVENFFCVNFLVWSFKRFSHVKSMFSENLSFSQLQCNVDTLKLCLRIGASRQSASMSEPTQTVWKQQLQIYDQLGWVFQRCYSLVSYFFFVRFHLYFQPVTKSFSVDGLRAPLFLKFVRFCKIGTLCQLVCERLFFLFQQNSCFSLSFIDIEIYSTLARIPYSSVSDIKNKNSISDTPWTVTKYPLAFISPDYRSRISKKGWNLLFFLKKKFFTKKELLQNQFSTFLNWW